MPLASRMFAAFLVLAALAMPAMASAQQQGASAQVAWRLLDYIAVDYPAAVADGRVISAAEYAEMREFSASVRERLAALPATSATPQLLKDADVLIAAIERRAPEAEVGQRARALAAELLRAYPTPLAPSAPPDLARGATLYAEQCASCHGATGAADGPGAKGLEPPPIAFTDLARARERSLFGLYQVVSQGLEGTAMASYGDLSPEDRWALAFYVGGLAFDARSAEAGERLWRERPDLRGPPASPG